MSRDRPLTMLLKFCNVGILELRYLASLLVESNGIFFAEHNVCNICVQVGILYLVGFL